MPRILIKDTEILTKQGTQTYNLVIDGDRIAYIGKDLPDNIFFEAIIDGKDLIAVPGMVNAHTHAAMTLLRSYADDMALMDRLQNKSGPLRRTLQTMTSTWGHNRNCVNLNRYHNFCRYVLFHGQGCEALPKQESVQIWLEVFW
jgi:5-methylthioadenosine/S-adenosylhomocysteine deaminase